jgi:cbb3-type cytochrome oxidase cytochrome c subunit
MIGLNALFHRRPAAIVVIGAAVFGALSFLIALRPALDLNAATAARPAASADPAVVRGRALYLAEGCGYCHSQFVRPLFIDAAYGRRPRPPIIPPLRRHCSAPSAPVPI